MDPPGKLNENYRRVPSAKHTPDFLKSNVSNGDSFTACAYATIRIHQDEVYYLRQEKRTSLPGATQDQIIAEADRYIFKEIHRLIEKCLGELVFQAVPNPPPSLPPNTWLVVFSSGANGGSERNASQGATFLSSQRELALAIEE